MTRPSAQLFNGIESMISSKQKGAIATVINTWRSSPRPLGSQLVVDEQLQLSGSVSGGCVESDVITLCQKAMQSQESCVHTYGVSDEKAWEVGLTCGGEITIHIEPIDQHTLKTYEQLQHAIHNRNTVYLLRPLPTGRSHVVANHILHDLTADQQTTLAREGMIETQQGSLQCIAPKTRIFVFGAVHVAVELAKFCHVLDYDITIIDPRPVFANRTRFPHAHLAVEWPDIFLKQHALDANTAICTLNHDPKFDDVALTNALASDAFYIGALGSSKTHEKRLARLHANGLTHQALARIQSPIGLLIGTSSATHIALSIAGQIVDEDTKRHTL